MIRLLDVRKLTFEEFRHPPPYAILSHRWTEHEAKLQDLTSPKSASDSASQWDKLLIFAKARGFAKLSGLAKVTGFAKFVEEHYPEIAYVWIDSCCIDRRNAVELSQAINRMFEWYSNANVCIAYLADIESNPFVESVWFRRGWTLQELLASRTVVFVNKAWNIIGDKGSLEDDISRQTSIPPYVLADFHGTKDKLTTGRILQWMEDRDTEEPEDIYYSLFGIFGVAPSVSYGEGADGAKHRLMSAIREKTRLKFDQETFHEIVSWIGCPDAWIDHQATRALHQPGTCEWLLRHEKYQKWLDGSVQHLWLHGKPGCGKTVLCSTVIEDVKKSCNQDIRLGIFYISIVNSHRQAYDDLLRSLIRQWGWREPAMSLLRDKYEQPDRRIPSTEELEQAVIAAASRRAFLIIDALDESTNEDVRQNFMVHLSRLAHKTQLQLFVTSRHLLDIRSTMRILHAEHISITPSDVQEDIHTYIMDKLTNIPRLFEFAPAIKATIENVVSSNAKGMFRWAALLIEELSRLRKSNKRTVDETLQHFPKNLDAIYARGLDAIHAEDRRETLILLQWLAYAREPLTLDQLIDALVIVPAKNTVEMAERGTISDIFRLVSSFIDIAPGSDEIKGNTKVTLAHASIKEYLESKEAGDFQLNHKLGHHLLEQSCITYVIFCSGQQSGHLLSYAKQSWYYHTKEMQPIDRTVLESNQTATAKILETADLVGKWNDFCGDPLQAAASKGDLKLVRHLLTLGAEVNAKVGHYGRPLQAACDEGYIDVVGALLEHGADVNAEGGWFVRALTAAAAKNKPEIVHLLLENGAEIDSPGTNRGAALTISSYSGHIEVVRLLLSRGANININAGDWGYPLQAAATNGRIQVVKELLAQGAEADAEGGRCGTALHAAVDKGHIDVVRILLEKADLESLDKTRKTPLHIAAERGRTAIVDLLLKAGAKTEVVCDHASQACTPLYFAATQGNSGAAKLLVEAGADLNARNSGAYTPINSAAYQGHVGVVQLLLDAGADINLANDVGWTPMESASRSGHPDIMNMLRKRSGRKDSRSSYAGSIVDS